MYNLNINMAATANAVNNLLSVESSCTTPRTPEILNSLIAMQNPLDNYNFGETAPKNFQHPNNVSSDSNSSSCSQESRTGQGPGLNTGPISVQQTCSQLIKSALKLSIEQKRKVMCDDGDDLLDLDKVKRIKKNESESEEDKYQSNNGLTPEDEERRRRRRERNKIAATKCRLKKRERTANLVTESETLETQNIELKKQLQELKTTQHRLIEMLNTHKAICQKNIRSAEYPSRLPPVNSVIEPNNHSFNNNNNCRTNSTENFNRGNFQSFNRNIYSKTPNIIVETINEEEYQSLTDLDNPSENFNYNYSQSYGGQGIDGCMA